MAPAGQTQSLHRAIDIIEYLYETGHEASISEVSEGTGLFASTVYRLLNTLKERGYVYQNENNSKYGLGLRLYTIGQAVKENIPLVNILEPMTIKVAEKYKGIVYIAVPVYQSSDTAQHSIVRKVCRSDYIPRNSVEEGAIVLSHTSALGKCIMAYCPPQIMEEYRKHPLIRLKANTLTDWDALTGELHTIQNNGYAIELEQETDGQTCIAVPVLDHNRHVLASIGLAGPMNEIFQYKINSIVEDLSAIVRQASDLV